MIYVNTEVVKINGQIAEKAQEKKFIWDEENRLGAIDVNGYVSNYTYDAGGERVTKLSGGGQGIFVNSVFAGGKTSTDFTLYVNPYLVAQNGGRYTKHIYIGSQRIVSKLGDFDSYGADPRRVEKAGESFSGVKVNYDAKYKKSLEVVKANYDTFEVPYYGNDNNDYVNGLGFCCNPTGESVSGGGSSITTGKMAAKNDNAELQQFYYHPDHLGSSSYISNLDGEVVQHIEYVPFGEVFLEEKNSKWNTPYLFTSKELDRETGLYYFGARYQDPKLGIFISVDPLAEKYPNYSSYTYALNNPVLFVDPDGRDIIIFYKINGQERKFTYTYEKGRNYDKLVNNKFLRNTVKMFDRLVDAKATVDIKVSGKPVEGDRILNTINDDRQLSVIETNNKGDISSNYIFATYIGNGKYSFNGLGTIKNNDEFGIEFNTDDGGCGYNSPTAQMGHEFLHQEHNKLDQKEYNNRKKGGILVKGGNLEERLTLKEANQINDKLGETLRSDYSGSPVKTNSPTNNKVE